MAGNLFSLLFLFPSLFLGVSYLANSYQSIVFPPLSLPYLTSSLTLWPVCLSLTTLAPLGPPALPTTRTSLSFYYNFFFLPYPPRNGTVLAVAASHRSYPPPRASRRFPTKALSSVEGGKQRRREQKKDTRLAWSSACPDWRTETEPKPLGYLRFLLGFCLPGASSRVCLVEHATSTDDGQQPSLKEKEHPPSTTAASFLFFSLAIRLGILETRQRTLRACLSSPRLALCSLSSLSRHSLPRCPTILPRIRHHGWAGL